MRNEITKEIIHEFEYNGEVMAVVLPLEGTPLGATLRNVDQLVKGHTVNTGFSLPSNITEGIEDFESEEFKNTVIEYAKSLEWFEKFVKTSGDNCRELYRELVESGEITE